MPFGPGERVIRDRWGEPLELPAERPARDQGDLAGLIGRIEALYAERGRRRYGEGVAQLEHALQAARLAERDGAHSALITAALLHDVGHLLDKRGEDAAERGLDTRHEAIGAGWLRRHFGEAVAAPVRLHVPAKRYLCAVAPGYAEALSPASRQSLRLQGGPMSRREAADFEAQPYAAAAVRLRRWDDAAKRVGAVTPDFAHFRPHLRAALQATG